MPQRKLCCILHPSAWGLVRTADDGYVGDTERLVMGASGSGAATEIMLYPPPSAWELVRTADDGYVGDTERLVMGASGSGAASQPCAW